MGNLGVSSNFRVSLTTQSGFGFNGPRSVGSLAPLEFPGARAQIRQINLRKLSNPESKHGPSLKTVKNNFEGVDKDVLDQYIAATKNPDGTVNENGVKDLLEFLKTNNLVQDESSLIGTTFCFDHGKFNIWDRCMNDLDELNQTIQQKIAALKSSSAGTTASGVASTTANSEAVTTSRSGLGTSSASSTQDLTTAKRLLTTALHLSSTPPPVGGTPQPFTITNSTGHDSMALVGQDIIVKTTLTSKETSTQGQTAQGATPVPVSGGVSGQAGAQGAPGQTAQGATPLPVPKGVPGAPGEQGAPGGQGAPGEQGASGGQGAPGEIGAPGEPGAPGQTGAPGQPAGSASIGLPERIGSYAGYGAFLLGILSLVKSYLNQSETTRLHEQYRLLQTQVPQAGNASVGRDMELGLDGSVSRVENTGEQDETQREDLNKLKEELNKLLEVFQSLLPQVDPSHRLGCSLVGTQSSTHHSNQSGQEPVQISQSPPIHSSCIV